MISVFGYDHFAPFLALWIALFISVVIILKGRSWFQRLFLAGLSVGAAGHIYELPDHIRLIYEYWLDGAFLPNYITVEFMPVFALVVYLVIVVRNHAFRVREHYFIPFIIVAYGLAYSRVFQVLGLSWTIPIFILRALFALLAVSIAFRLRSGKNDYTK